MIRMRQSEEIHFPMLITWNKSMTWASKKEKCRKFQKKCQLPQSRKLFDDFIQIGIIFYHEDIDEVFSELFEFGTYFFQITSRISTGGDICSENVVLETSHITNDPNTEFLFSQARIPTFAP